MNEEDQEEEGEAASEEQAEEQEGGEDEFEGELFLDFVNKDFNDRHAQPGTTAFEGPDYQPGDKLAKQYTMYDFIPG